MVNTFGNNIVSAFTNGTSVKAIYTYGVKVWPSEVPPTEYYIKWTPTNITGGFLLSGTYYDFQDYSSGIYNDFHGPAIITSSAFKETGITTLDTKVDLINESAFYGCVSLSQVSLYCEVVGSGAFRGCTSLSSIYAECTYISLGAFFNTDAKYIDLPYCSGISYLSNYKTFGGDEHSYMYVTLGYQGIVSGASAFGPYAIYRLTVPDWLVSYYKDSVWAVRMHGFPDVLNISGMHYISCPGYYSSYNSGGTLYSTEFENVSNINSVTTDATGVADNCFNGSGSLFEIYLSRCIAIGSSAFKNCYNLETVVVNHIRQIYPYAFQNCSKLLTVNLSTCWDIGSYAFAGCINLRTIRLQATFNGHGCALSGSTVFEGCDNLNAIYVPNSQLSAYKVSYGWSYFSSILIGY